MPLLKTQCIHCSSLESTVTTTASACHICTTHKLLWCQVEVNVFICSCDQRCDLCNKVSRFQLPAQSHWPCSCFVLPLFFTVTLIRGIHLLGQPWCNPLLLTGLKAPTNYLKMYWEQQYRTVTESCRCIIRDTPVCRVDMESLLRAMVRLIGLLVQQPPLNKQQKTPHYKKRKRKISCYESRCIMSDSRLCFPGRSSEGSDQDQPVTVGSQQCDISPGGCQNYPYTLPRLQADSPAARCA